MKSRHVANSSSLQEKKTTPRKIKSKMKNPQLKSPMVTRLALKRTFKNPSNQNTKDKSFNKTNEVVFSSETKREIPLRKSSRITRPTNRCICNYPGDQKTLESSFNKMDKDLSSSKTKRKKSPPQKSTRVTRQTNRSLCKSPNNQETKSYFSMISDKEHQFDKLDSEHLSPNISIPVKENTSKKTNSKWIKPKIPPRKFSRETRQTNRSICKSPNNQKTIESYFNKADKNMNVPSSMVSKEHGFDKLDTKYLSPNNISVHLKENNTPKKTNSKCIKPEESPRRSSRVTRQRNKYIYNSPSNQKTIESSFNNTDKNMNVSNSKISDNEHRFDKLNIKKFKPHKSSMKFKSCISPSAKFEGKVPKIDDILRTREESEQYVELKRMVEASAENFLKENKVKRNLEDADSIKPIKRKKIINCKHLSLPDIKKLFRKDVHFLDDIIFDKVYNRRHELFKQDTPKNNCTKNDLRVNETTCMFTEDQLIHIVSLFRERYDNGNIYKYSNFYFKVLLPEYCLKIFMECHKMTPTTALEYLKSTPVANCFGFFE